MEPRIYHVIIDGVETVINNPARIYDEILKLTGAKKLHHGGGQGVEYVSPFVYHYESQEGKWKKAYAWVKGWTWQTPGNPKIPR
ncbi:MAG: hypothetical protein AB7D37_05585 [Desulfovibrio sp.]